MRLRHVLSAIGSGAALALACGAFAQGWPARPVHWIVPFPPGGAADLTARVLSSPLGERLKQPVLIENRPGAASNIGMELAAKSPPDGYTIVFVIPNVVTASLLYRIDYEPMKELTPVSQLTGVFFVMLVTPSLPARSLADVLALARQKPGALTCASGGGMSQLACEMLRVLGKTDITFVPYKGLAPAMTDLAGGQISMTFDITSTALPHVRANRARAIATTNDRRIDSGPYAGLPTLSETFAGFDIIAWQGVMAPAGTPRDIVLRLNREIGAALEDAQVRQKLVGAGLEIAHGSPQEFAELMQRDYVKYGQIIRASGMKPQ
jgi:tripartite-type tricarboxylate transporter receptor subunit TctC